MIDSDLIYIIIGLIILIIGVVILIYLYKIIDNIDFDKQQEDKSINV